MKPCITTMTVVRCPGTDKKPMVKISNAALTEIGLHIGDKILVTYEKHKITIVKTQ